MNKQQLFENAIKKEDFKTVNLLINDPEVSPEVDDNRLIRFAYSNLKPYTVATLFKNDKVRNLLKINHAKIYYKSTRDLFYNAVELNELDKVKRILSESDFDPTAYESTAFMKALRYEANEVVAFLWKMPNIRTALQKDRPNIYEDIIKNKIQLKLNNF